MKLLLSVLLLSVFFSSCSSLKNNSKILYLDRASSGKAPFYYTDIYGNIQIREHFQEARQFCNNLAAVKKNSKWGFINPRGEVKIPFQYDWVSSFGEFGFNHNIAIAKTNINKDRNPMFTPSKTVLINTEGDTIAIYGFVSPIINGISIVNNGFSFKNVGRSLSSSEGLWGCINKRGKEIIKCEYDLMYPFYNNITFVRKKGLWGCINKRGKKIIECKYNNLIYNDDNVVINTFNDINRENKEEKYIKKGVIYMFLQQEKIAFDKKGNRIDTLSE